MYDFAHWIVFNKLNRTAPFHSACCSEQLSSRANCGAEAVMVRWKPNLEFKA